MRRRRRTEPKWWRSWRCRFSFLWAFPPEHASTCECDIQLLCLNQAPKNTVQNEKFNPGFYRMHGLSQRSMSWIRAKAPVQCNPDLATATSGPPTFALESWFQNSTERKTQISKQEIKAREMDFCIFFVTLLFVHCPAYAFLGALLQPISILQGSTFSLTMYRTRIRNK